MTGRVIIVTGASSGIGFEVSRQLAEGGNDLILACKSDEKADDAVRRIKAEFPNSLIQKMQLDLSSMSSVREFVKEFTRKKKKLHILVNCAAMKLSSKDFTRKTTTDGLELTMATNYFGMFLLTNLLLDYLLQTANIAGDCRVLNVTCAGHDQDNSFLAKGLKELEMENLQLQKEGTYSAEQAYKNSKLCVVLFTNYLAQQIANPRLTVNAMDPGFVPKTSLMRHASVVQRGFSVCCLHNTLRCLHVTKTAKKAATEIVDLVTSEKHEGRSGKYFKDGAEDRSSVESYDVDLQKALWKQSCRLLDYRSSLIEEDMDRISLGSKPEDPLLRK